MVKWSAPAKRDLREIHRYIALDSKYYAGKVLETIVDKAELLSRSPRIGRVVPEIEDMNIREIFVYSYRLIYEIGSEGIEILGVIHGRRDFFGNSAEL
ncbi:MAG: type II toxin-antitoxin system RelE/ParE family toxin [Deltaproteobacteria bacterium CG_4_8_14_3_um_filter_51_11]|nr:type II toxin-antitoxin system RelE/ParE family toxin [bacterium]OIP40326.1 MAG: addiction module toxin RelE [Desulfobacteraceae bacterium CG2_30_51_40]PIP47820.1 MAG: addiction module toxin RelE [Deltaproteobacteria bacterium CG23_combo_of_CG06-09_8_20_14_all_51_20]PIX20359.1 MAG: type II toxin-antitoxin system RelE/ParE family toxin [Deltaproteobacteria bacterium CG_4_8_14_3_um_filter_51_11]PIY24560.1 MAG: type II toxin-antitoxin system RelE/ParE family toxin [Deltaproteobacteria bacterium